MVVIYSSIHHIIDVINIYTSIYVHRAACAFTYGTLAFSEYEGAQIGITKNTWNVSNTNPVSFQVRLMLGRVYMYTRCRVCVCVVCVY